MKFDRSKKPLPSSGISFKIPIDEKFSLDNELDVYFIQKCELPIVRINIIINAGSKFDPENRKGTSNLLTMCLDEGAGNFNALELSEQFDLLGAQFSLYCSSDNIQLTLQTLKENFSEALGLLGSILTEPHLNKNDFEREKRKVLTRLKQLSDDPEYLANTSFELLLFGKQSPYSFPALGIDSNIETITNEEIRSYYGKSILSNNAFIIAVGDISVEDLRTQLDECFSEWSKRKFDLQTNFNGNDDKKKIYIVDKKDSVQTEIRIGHQTSGRDSKDYFNKHIMNLILGGQFTSRINLNLREKHGYTYGAGSNFNYYKDAAYFGVSTSVGIDNTANALKEIVNELENIRLGVTREELEFAKSSIVRKFPLNFETYRQLASNIIGKVIYDLPEDYFDTYIEKINSITAKDVNKAAAENIFPDDTTTVLVGDKDRVLEQLKNGEFGEVKVVE
jgi:zinc protease